MKDFKLLSKLSIIQTCYKQNQIIPKNVFVDLYSSKDFNKTNFGNEEREIINCMQQCLNAYKDIFAELQRENINGFLESFNQILELLSQLYGYSYNTYEFHIINESLRILQSCADIIWLVEGYINSTLLDTLHSQDVYNITYKLYENILHNLNKFIMKVTNMCKSVIAITQNNRVIYSDIFSEEKGQSNVLFYFRTSLKFKENYVACKALNQDWIWIIKKEMLIHIENIILEFCAFNTNQSISYSQYFIEYFNRAHKNHVKSSDHFDQININPKYINAFMKILWHILNRCNGIEGAYLVYVQSIFGRFLKIAQASPDPKATLGLLYLNDNLMGFDRNSSSDEVDKHKLEAFQIFYKILGAEPVLEPTFFEAKAPSNPKSKPTADYFDALGTYHTWLSRHFNYYLAGVKSESLRCLGSLLPGSVQLFERHFLALLPLVRDIIGRGDVDDVCREVIDVVMTQGYELLGSHRNLATTLPAIFKAMSGVDKLASSTILGQNTETCLIQIVVDLPYQTLIECLRTCLTFIKLEPCNPFYARFMSICLRNFAFDRTTLSDALKRESGRLISHMVDWLATALNEKAPLETFWNLCNVTYDLIRVCELISTYDLVYMPTENLNHRILSLLRSYFENPYWFNPESGDCQSCDRLEALLSQINFAILALRVFPPSLAGSKQNIHNLKTTDIKNNLFRSISRALAWLKHLPNTEKGNLRLHCSVDCINTFMSEVKILLAMVERSDLYMDQTDRHIVLQGLSELFIFLITRQKELFATLNHLIVTTATASPAFVGHLHLQGWRFIYDQILPVMHEKKSSFETKTNDISTMLSNIHMLLISDRDPHAKHDGTELETLMNFIINQGNSSFDQIFTKPGLINVSETKFIGELAANPDSCITRCLSFISSLPNEQACGPDNSLPFLSSLALCSLILYLSRTKKLPENSTHIVRLVLQPLVGYLTNHFNQIPFPFAISIYLLASEPTIEISKDSQYRHFPSLLARYIAGLPRDGTLDVSQWLKCLMQAWSRNPVATIDLLGYLYEELKSSSMPWLRELLTPFISTTLTQISDSITRLPDSYRTILKLAIMSHKLLSQTPPQTLSYSNLNSTLSLLFDLSKSYLEDLGKELDDKELPLVLHCLISSTSAQPWCEVVQPPNGLKRKADSVDMKHSVKKKKNSQNNDFLHKFNAVLPIMEAILSQQTARYPTSALKGVCNCSRSSGPSSSNGFESCFKALSDLLLQQPYKIVCWALAALNQDLEDFIIDSGIERDPKSFFCKFCLHFLLYTAVYTGVGSKQIKDDENKGTSLLKNVYKLCQRGLDMWSASLPQLVPSYQRPEHAGLLVMCALAQLELLRALIKYTNKFGEAFSAALLSFDTTAKPLIKHYRRSCTETSDPSTSEEPKFEHVAYTSLIRANLSLWSYCVMKKPKAMLTSYKRKINPPSHHHYGAQFMGLAQALIDVASEIAMAPTPLILDISADFAKLLSACSRAFREYHTDVAVNATRYHVLPHAFAALLSPLSVAGFATTSIISATARRILRGTLIEIMSNLDKSSLLYLQAMLSCNGRKEDLKATLSYTPSAYFTNLYSEFIMCHKYMGKN